MRNSIQRKIILDAVQKMHNHPTAEDIYREIQKEHPIIGKSTVYRNLHQLTNVGEIRSVLVPNSPERFDDTLLRHYHFNCRTCGGVFDVNVEYLSGINEAIQNVYSFQVDEHDVIFKGICAKCKK